jgi:protein-disulfide isomerase
MLSSFSPRHKLNSIRKPGRSPLRSLRGRWLALVLLMLAVAIVAHAQDQVLAIVNDQKITLKQVDELLVSKLFPLQQQIYALRKSALENLIIKALLEDEARKRRVRVDELRKQLTVGPVSVSVNEIEDFYQENALAFGAMSPDEAREKLRLDLETQARLKNYRQGLAKLKESSRIDMFLEEPTLLMNASSEFAAATGSKTAAVTIVEFSDFECSYCRNSQSTIKELLKQFPQDVRLVFRHLPLQMHPQAFPSAQAAYCASEQDRFWQYHDALFALEQLSADVLEKVANDIGLNMDRFKTCLASDTSRTVVRKDVEEARRLGINSTPTFIVNGKLVRGAIPFADFKSIVEKELRSANGVSSSQ